MVRPDLGSNFSGTTTLLFSTVGGTASDAGWGVGSCGRNIYSVVRRLENQASYELARLI